jgi:4-hydroxy-3-methylbut-2-enyl diphosphate reductase
MEPQQSDSGKKNLPLSYMAKPTHEETRATFSHAAAVGPALVIRDMEEAILLSRFIRKEKPEKNF